MKKRVPGKVLEIRVRLTPQEMRLYVEKADARADEGRRGGISDLVREAVREKLARESGEAGR